MAERHAQLERAAKGATRYRVVSLPAPRYPPAAGRYLRQLARAQRGDAAEAAARRPSAQLEREYRTIIVSR